MNLNCPSCGTRFRLPDGALRDTGRKLRCAACKHVWFQTLVGNEPAPEPVVQKTQEPERPAPAAETTSPIVARQPEQPPEPAPDDEAEKPVAAPEPPHFVAPPPAEPEKPGDAEAGSRDNVLPYLNQPHDSGDQGDDFRSSAPPPVQHNKETPEPAYDISRVVTPDSATEEDRNRKGGSWFFKLFLLLVIAGFLFTGYQWRGKIMTMAPWTISSYEMVGLFGAPTSLGLEYRDVTFSVDEQNGYSQLTISGRVVNIGSEFVRLPEMRAELLDEFGATLRDWSFSASASGLGPGDQALFHSTYPDPPRTGDEFYLFMTFEDMP